MNIRNIMLNTNGINSGKKSMFDNQSLLSIGSKGQVVEGVISSVSDKISINFSGVEVKVPSSAVQNATEGEKRKFQIMDVSKENIVLKEIGNTQKTQNTKAMASTTVAESSYDYAGHLKGGAQVAEGVADAKKNISVLTGEDYQSLEEDEGALEKYQDESLDRAVERIKEQRKWKEKCQESNEELCAELEQGLEELQKLGFLGNKSEGQIRQALIEADIPVNAANISNVASALMMSKTASDISDDTKAYIIGSELSPTIENIYQGQYSGSDAVSGDIYDMETWQQLEPQVQDIIELTGLDKDMALSDAQWLFANDLPVNAQNLKTLNILSDIQQNMTLDKTLEQIVQAMAAGNEAKEASLDVSEFVIARSYINEFMSFTDEDVHTAVQLAQESTVNAEEGAEILNLSVLRQAQVYNQQNMNQNGSAMNQGSSREGSQSYVIPGAVKDGMSEVDIKAVTAKRQLAEICLKMTAQSANRMMAKGIDIETAPLGEIVDELRSIENDYYAAQAGALSDITDEELSLMQETLQKTSDIAGSHAALVGVGVRQMNLVTFNELHAAAISENFQRSEFLNVYERVATQVNKEYGDSIQKAFAGIPDMLSELGMEATQANERAVRILGYNSMEVTVENITDVKVCDSAINRIIDNMKPSVVLDMIRKGDNPLDKSIAQLDAELEEIVSEKGLSSEEKYSRYLWQLEKDNAITEQERDGYIGVYRLLNNIEKSDGAAIGAVIQTKQDMTLGNLLKAVRTMKKGIDTKVDDNFGGLSDIVYSGKSITDQISNGFQTASMQNTSDTQTGYFDRLVSDTIDIITPAKVNEISDGDMETLLNSSVEKFAEDMKAASGNKQIEKEYYEAQAENLREMYAQSSQAAEYLENVQIPSTMANLAAAEQLLENGYSPLKESYKKKDILSENEQKGFEEVIKSMPEALNDEESIQKQCELAEKYMGDILSGAYESADITSEELSSLKMLSQGIRLQASLVRSRNYDIPILTGDTITNMNVTILTGSNDSGKVKISMKSDGVSGDSVIGNISAEFKVVSDKVKGLILCDDRDSYDALMADADELKSSLQQSGLDVRNISYGMNYSSASAMTNEKTDNSNTKTSELYKVAKTVVRYIQAFYSRKEGMN